MALTYVSDTYNGFERGSYLFTKEQRDSLRLIVDIEILSRVGEASFNYKYPVPQSFYGYAQVFYGSSNYGDIALKYGRNRVLDVVNWQSLLSQIDRRQNLYLNQMFNWLASSSLEFEAPQPEAPDIYEIFSLRETQIKVNTEYLSAFQIIVTWLPFNLLSPYGEIPDSDTQDPSDGRDDYPEPLNEPSDSPLPEEYTRTPPNPLSNPRDYPDDSNNLANWGTILQGLIEAWNGTRFVQLSFNVSLAGYHPDATVDASDDAVPGGVYQGKQTYFGYTVTFANGTKFGPLQTAAGYTKGSAVVLNRTFIPPE